MKRSTNTLMIKEMRFMDRFEEERITLKVHCELLVELQCKCPVTGQLFKTMSLSAQGSAYSDLGAARRCVQAFLDGVVSAPDTRIHNSDIQCLPHNGVDHLDVLLQEPMKSLFIGLFDPTTWSMDGQGKRSSKMIER